MSARVWPICTTYLEDCGHVMTHESPGEATEFARDHKAGYVNPGGYAICACHPDGDAEARGVTPFPCDESRAPGVPA